MQNNIEKTYKLWLEKIPQSDPLHDELTNMSSEQINNAFYKDLEFGTGGLRGIMGAGSNCLNKYTIIKATAGLACYMKKHGLSSAAITYDSRINSKEFSFITAETLASYGITAYITDTCMPTPFLSFAIRKLNCDVGVNVTASHNPKQYNGYKVYDKTGCQVLDKIANAITDEIEKIDPFDQNVKAFDELIEEDKIKYISDTTKQDYYLTVESESLDKICPELNIVYTPLNGAGHIATPTVLKKMGAKNLTIVPEQSYPDGNFTTCPYPNPEKIEALSLAIKLANETGADIVVANDPDCDRLGVAVQKESGFAPLTGNEVGILLVDYILSRRKENGTLPETPQVVTTIVSTPMINALAKDYNATVVDVLTGFKYIGDVINRLEKHSEQSNFVFGFEESCGYLKGTYARDKDGVVAAMLVCEMASYYKKQGLSLYQRLLQLFDKYGRYDQCLLSYRFEGADGAVLKQELLSNLRKHPFENLAESPTTSTTDLLEPSTLPKADVLIWKADDGTKLVIRPSGTEPLIKCYLFTNGDSHTNLKKLDKLQAQLDMVLAK